MTPIDHRDVWVHMLAGKWEPDEHHVATVTNKVRAAYERLKAGGDDDDFDEVAGALNVAVVRAEMIGAGPLTSAILAKKTIRTMPLAAQLQLAAELRESLAMSQVWIDAIKKAMEALVACDQRMQRTGRSGFDGMGILAMNDALDKYQEILRASSGEQMEQAVAQTLLRSKAQQRHNA